ncbi:MAG TPA: family 2A encapsulin nanocompartment cargo protein cysteine desulfurase [Burkholderiaceae bacterium]|nr:family 2A encapsulin nanocompartment cargo protein cysteine desulfurase [Burkholderiaceae bacterium]
MQTPTSELPAGPFDTGLLDIAALTELANSMFSAPPGQAPANPLPPGASLGPFGNGPLLPGTLVPGGNALPGSPQDIASIAAAQPARAPKAEAGNGVPDVVYTAAPALDSRLGGAALGVPPALAPGAAPFYFLDGGVPGAALAPTGGYYFTEFAQPANSPDALPHASASAHPPFDVQAIRRDFPILAERVNGRPLAWFDNAATTHKPQCVIDRLAYFYAHENSNIHRAAHELAARATDAYEGARKKVADFIGAGSVDEIVFVRGTTEGINLVAATWGERHIGAGDEIIVSHLEHHANIVPWQMLCRRKGATLRVIPVDDSGQVLLEDFKQLLSDKTKLVSVTQVSNALGTVVPVKEIVEIAHRAGAAVLIDGAQSVSHMAVDVRALDADFFVFSGHKIFGPTGIGAVYGKRAILEDLPPYQGGGNMIQDVTFEKTVYHAPPTRFEAGTGNIADAVGLGAALDYVQRVGIENIGRYEHELLTYATHQLALIPGVRLIGTARDKASVLSFVLDGHSTDEVGQALNQEGIAVRTGHHCAQPILRRFGLEATVRASLAFYNTVEEVDRLVVVVRRLAGSRR